ncbi:tyrosine-type recombinase/integrase [Balneolaceae bacterium ANBcel3]|nr:tyrosine-type recombinase/integrase [Balneolaceae bacterium ANBcel3]
MSEARVSKVFNEYKKLVSCLPKDLCMHGVRHSCGTELHRLGMDIMDIGKFLGNSLEVTKIYVQTNEIDLQKKLKDLN